MGKKRRYEEMDEDKILRKIQKLQNTLQRKRNKSPSKFLIKR